jgi:hypothetical protein
MTERKINLVYNKFVSGNATTNISRPEFYNNLKRQTSALNLCVFLTNGTNKRLDDVGNGTTAAFKTLSDITDLGNLFDVTSATTVFDSNLASFEKKNEIDATIKASNQVWTPKNKYNGMYAGSVIRVDVTGTTDFPVCGGYHINGIEIKIIGAADKIKVENNSVGLVKAYYTAIMDDFFKLAIAASSSSSGTSSGKHYVLHLAQIPGDLYGGTQITGNAFHTAVTDWIATKASIRLSVSMTISIDFAKPVSDPVLDETKTKLESTIGSAGDVVTETKPTGVTAAQIEALTAKLSRHTSMADPDGDKKTAYEIAQEIFKAFFSGGEDKSNQTKEFLTKQVKELQGLTTIFGKDKTKEQLAEIARRIENPAIAKKKELEEVKDDAKIKDEVKYDEKEVKADAKTKYELEKAAAAAAAVKKKKEDEAAAADVNKKKENEAAAASSSAAAAAASTSAADNTALKKLIEDLKVGNFSTYRTTSGPGEKIPFDLKPAQQFLKGLGVTSDVNAKLSSMADGKIVQKSGNSKVVVNSFDPEKTSELTIAGDRIDTLINSAKTYVNTNIISKADFLTIVNKTLKTQTEELHDGKYIQNIAVGVCHSQKIDLLAEPKIVANGTVILAPKNGNITKDTNAILLLSSPALNLAYGSGVQLSNEDKIRYIEGMYRNLFNAAVAESYNYIALPAAGLGAFAGEDIKEIRKMYFRILTRISKEFPNLNIIYHSGVPANASDFDEIFEEDPSANLVRTDQDVMIVAHALTQGGKPCAYHNPSDADVVLGIYDVGEYWKEGNYVAEEHIGAMTTAPLNSRLLNPAAYSTVVEYYKISWKYKKNGKWIPFSFNVQNCIREKINQGGYNHERYHDFTCSVDGIEYSFHLSVSNFTVNFDGSTYEIEKNQ